VFSKESRTKLFHGGMTHEYWAVRLFCRGAFSLTYVRVEGNVTVIQDTIEGVYCLAVAPGTDFDGFVPRPTNTGTLASTIALHSHLRLTLTNSPVHWEEDTVGTAIPFDKVFHMAAFPPADPEWVTVRGFVTLEPDGMLPALMQDSDSNELVLQREREQPKILPYIPIRLNRSLMATDVDTRSPARFFNTGPISSNFKRSFSTGALRACGPSPGWGFSKYDMAKHGNQALIVRTDTKTQGTKLLHNPAAHPPHNASLRRYG
jgi:hypothetical protein